MDRKNRKIEEKLLVRIGDYKKTFRSSFREEFLKEKEERLEKGEVCYNGIWIPQDKILDVQKVFLRKKTVVFCEMNILILLSFFIDCIMLLLFIKFLLP